MFYYRVFKSTWGLSVGLLGSVEFLRRCRFGLEIAPRIFVLDVEGVLLSEEVQEVAGAVLRHRTTLDARRGERTAVVILSQAVWADTDFQTEGLGAAVTTWLSELLDVENPLTDATFDRTTNKYRFEYRVVT
jgi:hypothetical protein